MKLTNNLLNNQNYVLGDIERRFLTYEEKPAEFHFHFLAPFIVASLLFVFFKINIYMVLFLILGIFIALGRSVIFELFLYKDDKIFIKLKGPHIYISGFDKENYIEF